MYNKALLIGYVIQIQSDDERQEAIVTLETHSEDGSKKERNKVMACKRLYDVAFDIATPGELIRVEGYMSNKNGVETRVYAHNIAKIRVEP